MPSTAADLRKCGHHARPAIGIIGHNGAELSRVSYGGQETTIMIPWPDETGYFGSRNATLDNDRLGAKGSSA